MFQGCCELLRLVDLAKCDEFREIVPAGRLNDISGDGNGTQKAPIFLDMESSLQFMRSINEVDEQKQRTPESRTRTPASSAPTPLPVIKVNNDDVVGESQPGGKPSPLDLFRKAAQTTPAERLRAAAWAVQAASKISNRKKVLAKSTEPNPDYGRVGIGMFVKVDLLRPGQAFVSTDELSYNEL